MPTKRTRKAHGIGLTDEVLAVLGVGTGINHMPDAELKSMWREHGAAVTDYWQRKYGTEPFVAIVAREEQWTIPR
jgi:hypothetical protein